MTRGVTEGGPLTPTPEAIAWTADRRELHELLAQQHPDLGGLYELAITELAAGLTLPRLLTAAHCLRELVSGLPTVLGEHLQARSDVTAVPTN